MEPLKPPKFILVDGKMRTRWSFPMTWRIAGILLMSTTCFAFFYYFYGDLTTAFDTALGAGIGGVIISIIDEMRYNRLH